mgnify:CR=1 FL=1
MSYYLIERDIANYTYSSQAFMTYTSPQYFFNIYTKEPGVPIEANYTLTLDSYAASGSSSAYVYVTFYDASDVLLMQIGYSITTTGFNKRDFKVDVPPTTSYFRITAKIRAFVANRINYDGLARVRLVDATYASAVEPKIAEVIVSSSVKKISTRVTRSYETINRSKVRKIESRATAEVQTSSYSHVEPIHTAVTRSAMAVTSTKGNKISTNAFANVETTTSSFVKPIASKVEVQKKGHVTVNSHIAPVNTSAHSEPVIHTKSFSKAYRSTAEIVKKKEIVITSTVSPIKTSASVERSKKKEIVIVSKMSRIASEVETSKSKIISNRSYTKKIASRTDISHSKKREVVITSSVKKLATDVQRAAEVHPKSSVKAIRSEVVVETKKLPKKETRIVTSSVGRVTSRAKLEKEVIVRSYIKPSSSKAHLSSFETSVTSSVSNIKSGVEVSRTRKTAVITVTSSVRPLRHDIITERRKLKMRLNELKIRLQIPAEDTSNDDLLLVLLDDAIDFVQRACNQIFDPMPPTAKKVVAQYVSNELAGNRHIRSEWIADMKQEFESSEERDKALTNILRKSGLIKLRFAPLGGR